VKRGLIAAWPLAGDARESVGGNDGQAENVVFQREGEFPHGVFNGRDSLVQVKLDKALVRGEFTVSAWVKTSGEFEHGSGLIVGRSGYYNGWRLLVTDRTHKNDTLRDRVCLQIGAEKGAVSCWGLKQRLTPGQWHHLVGLWNGVWLKVYIDGRLGYSRHYEGEYRPARGLLAIGYHDLGVGHFKGNIGDVRIWNRALDRAEIKMLRQESSTGPANTAVSSE